MNADEIERAQFEMDDGAWESARWLKQIALQLARLNEQLKPLEIRDRTFDYPEGRK